MALDSRGFQDWVNVVPVTAEGELVLVRQYRAGTRSWTLEIPGGTMDQGEDPEAAARRELLEETGYGEGEWTLLGTAAPNPAIQNNRCHFYLARGVRRLARRFDHALGALRRLLAVRRLGREEARAGGESSPAPQVRRRTGPVAR